MKRDSYSDQQSHARFQPQSLQSEIKPTQFGQPFPHSSSTSNLGSNWLDKASSWVADKVQSVQNLVQGSGKAILQERGYANASDQILPALRGTASQSAQFNQPLIGVIDSGFGADEHGSKIVEAIQQENPQAQIWQGGGVGAGDGLESLVEFVDTAKAMGHSQAVANLSFDLTEVHPDGSISTRSQLTAEEQSALAYARNNGVLVVASSGNQGGAMSALGQASQPFDHLIVVGAANGQERAAYSSYGKGLDLVAKTAAGTSFATAKVTSAIANIWNTNPELSSHQVSQILTTTTTDLNRAGWDAETGAGLLNVKDAINLAQSTTPEPEVFSGAQLIQQVNGTTWESRNGAIASERTAGFGSWLKQNAHGVLDVAGFIPGVGAVADLANAGLYAAEGDYANAALSAAAAVPGIGDAAAAAKLANRGVRAAQAANRGTRATERATSGARAIPSRSRPSSPPAPRPASPSRATRPGGGSSLSPTGHRRPAAPRPALLSTRRAESGRPSAAPGRRRPASDRPASTASRRPDSARRRERQPVAGSSRRPSPSPQERRLGVGTGNRPATRRQPNHQSGLGATRRPQSTRPESNPRSSPSTPPQAKGQVTIRRGDTLWEIAERQLGSGTRWGELRKADGSPFTERDARRLQPGTSVRLPDTQPRRTKTPTQSPWSPTPAKTPDPTPYIHTTGDRKYALDPVILSRLDEIRQGESLSEFAKRIKTKMWDNNNGSPTGNGRNFGNGGSSPSRPNRPGGDSSRPLSTPKPNNSNDKKPTSIDASKLLPNNATPEDVAMLQKILDQHPELSNIRSQATTLAGRKETFDWLKKVRENPEQSYNPYSTQPDLSDPSTTTRVPYSSTEEMRRQPGKAEGGENLPDTDRLLPLTEDSKKGTSGQISGNIGMVPGQIARRMQEMHFDNFRQFRETFWKFVEQDKNLREGWKADNLDRMRQGKAPFAPGTERVGSERVYQLDHSHDLQHGGGVYDLDSIRIVTPRSHDKYGN